MALRTTHLFTRFRSAVLALAGLALLPSIAWAADPQIASFVDVPDPVAAGANYDYQIRIDNNAGDDALNTRIRVTVPSGATFVAAAPAGANCVLTTPTQVDCNLGTVGALGADVRNITMTWRALGPGPDTIGATLSLTADNDVNLANNTQAQNTTVTNGADLSLNKSGLPDPVVGGANVTYTLTTSNAGPNAAGNITLTDTLSPSTSFVSAAGTGWSCSHSAGVVTCNRTGPHAVGAAIPVVTIVARVNASGGSITNSASIAPATVGGVTDPVSTNNTATATTSVLAGADVNIAQKIVTSAVPAVAGTNVTFRVDARNGGPSAAVNAQVVDTLPPGWTFVSAVGTGWTCANAGSTVTCTRATLPVGATDNITVVATAPSNAAVGPTGTAYTNSATITSETTDPNSGNNTRTVNVTVLPDGADLRIAKSKSPNPVAQGSNLTSLITVTNNGPRVATGPLRVVEVLNGESYVSATGTGWVCTPNAAVVVCDHPNAANLAVNASLPVLTIVTVATVNGAATNNACVGSSVPPGAGAATPQPPLEGDPNNTNDCVGASSLSTTTQPDLAIAKTTSTPSGDKTVADNESSVTYTLVVTNASLSAQDATGVRITDTVPAFIAGRTTITAPVVATVSVGSTATFSCAVATATVTCTQTGGALSTGQTVTVPITVNRAMTSGSFTNTATVTNTAQGDPNPGNNSASDTVTIAPIADVEMTGKTVTPASVRAGENATYVLSFRNNGPSTAAGVVLTDTFTFPVGDSGVTVVSLASSKAGSTCSIGAGAVLNPGSAAYTCTIGSMANGEVQSVTLVVRPNFQTGNPARSFSNIASLTTATVENPTGGDNGNNARSAALSVLASSVDLLVNKTDVVDPVPFLAGATFLDYVVRVNSSGPSYATGVRVTDTMTPPAGRRVRFVCDVTAAGGSTCNSPSLCTATNVTSGVGTALAAFSCDVPVGTATTGLGRAELASGQFKELYLRFEALDQPASSGDIFTNVAVVSSNEADGVAGNNTESEQTTTRQRVDVRVTKSVSVGTVTLRQPFTWSVNVVNNGPGNALQTDLTDTLPAGLSVTGPITWTRTLQPGSGTCALAGQTVTCGLGQLDAGGAVTITIPTRVDTYPGTGSLTNTATVDADPLKLGGLDVSLSDNTGTAVVNVTRSSLSGTVFEDRDRAGANGGVPQGPAAEPRINGVVVQLTGTDAYGNAVNLSATTDASGNYTFNDLAPSNAAGYTLTQTQPPGYVNSPVAVPSAGGGSPTAGGTYASGGGSGDSSFSGIVLGANVAGANYNFPEVRRPSLSGFVYVDANGNGVRDAATDPAIVGATVRLLNANTLALVNTAITNGSGAYAFTNLDPLTPYIVEEPLPSAPANLQNGVVNTGLVGGAACAPACVAQPNTPLAGTDRVAAIDLSSGVDGTVFNFGETQLTAISGLVFVDSNRNNALDGTDTLRIGGVALRLVAGNDCAAGPLLQATTTAPDGTYSFSGVAAGQNYALCQTQPAGYANGASIPGTNAASGGFNEILITALPLAGSPGNHFAERMGSIGGSVWLDANNDGVRQGAEVGLAGVTMTLSGNDFLGNAVSRSVTSDGTGAWRFDDVPAAGAAGYTVTEQAAQPVVATVPTLNGRTVAGTVGGLGAGTPTAVSTLPSAVSGIALPAGADSINNFFAEILPVGLSGVVFIDVNNNGLQNLPGDAGLGGVSLTITGTDDLGGAVTRNISTLADGSYGVTDLRPGTYNVTQPTQPAGTANGRTIAGTAGGAVTPPATVPSAITGVVLTTPGTSSTGNNFAEIPTSSSINGRVWLDANNNGVIDGTESGIANVTIEVTGTDLAGQPVSRTTTTNATGDYTFAGMPPGTYAIRQPTQPADTLNATTVAGSTGGTATTPATTPSVISAVPLAVAQISAANNFGEIPQGQISGRVWADNNNNGVIDATETGLGGVALTLTGTDDLGAAVTASLVTTPDGRYAFTGLRPGTYTVTQPVQPLGTVNGTTVPGTLGGTAAAPAVLPSVITGIVLPVGGTSLENNFGEIGNSPDLRVSKRHTLARFTVGKTGDYTISVRNAGEAATSGVYTVSDRLPTGLTLAATPTGTGWICVGAAGATSFSCSSSDVIAAGSAGVAPITVTVQVAASAVGPSPVDNVVMVEGGAELDARRPTATERNAFGANPPALPLCTPTIDHNACRDPVQVQLAASVSGTVWFESGSTPRVLDAGDRRLAGWRVEVVDVATGTVMGSALTGADGSYRVGELVPGVELTVRFRDPNSNVVFGYPANGETAPGSSGVGCSAAPPTPATMSSCVGSGASPYLTVVLSPGQDLPQQSLPVDPSGVVYDASTRQPVPGAVVTLAPVGTCSGWNASTGIVGATLGGYTVVGQAVSMTVGSDGFYQFLIAPSAPASCTFGLTVTPPTGYLFVSTLIPPTPGPLVAPGGVGSFFSVQPQATAPTAPVGTGTTYYLSVVSGSAGANIVHNHIPLDQELPAGASLTKTGDRAVAEVGDTLRYAITVQVSGGARPRQTTVVDRLPAGFTYIPGTATANDLPIADPQGGRGPRLAFNLGAMPTSGAHVLRYRVRVGVGAQQGDGINRAIAHVCANPAGCVGADFNPQSNVVTTNEGRHRVVVQGGVFTTDACMVGKIYLDCNNNHVQDREELGIPGVRLVLSDGTQIISDSEGKYSMCGLPPRSHVLKVDATTLPRGSRLTTTSNRNLGDAGSLWLDLKNGELHRADFAEGSCSNTVIEQVKARRAQGEVRAPETEKKGGPALRFDSKAHQLDTLKSPQQGTDGANQKAPKAREPKPASPRDDESNVPTPALPMNQPPPKGRNASSDAAAGGQDGKR